jgi:hypothetical protein
MRLTNDEMLSLDEETNNHLELIETTEFDIFKLRQSSKENELKIVLNFLMNKRDLIRKFKFNQDRFILFTTHI